MFIFLKFQFGIFICSRKRWKQLTLLFNNEPLHASDSPIIESPKPKTCSQLNQESDKHLESNDITNDATGCAESNSEVPKYV